MECLAISEQNDLKQFDLLSLTNHNKILENKKNGEAVKKEDEVFQNNLKCATSIGMREEISVAVPEHERLALYETERQNNPLTYSFWLNLTQPSIVNFLMPRKGLGLCHTGFAQYKVLLHSISSHGVEHVRVHDAL